MFDHERDTSAVSTLVTSLASTWDAAVVTLATTENNLMQPLNAWTTKFQDTIGDKVTSLPDYLAKKNINGAMSLVSKARWVIPELLG